MIDESLAGLIVISEQQIVPLLKAVQADRQNLLMQIACLTEQRDANASLASTLNREKHDLQARIDVLAPSKGGVPIGQFYKRLVPLRLRLLQSSSPEIKEKWAVILHELDRGYTVIYPQDSLVASLIQEAIVDKLLSEEESVDLAAPIE